MVALCTIEDVKKSSRIDAGDEDDLVEMLIEAASAAVLKYLKLDPDDLFVTTAGLVDDASVPVEARWATIVFVGYLYENREADPDKSFGHGTLPFNVTALLYPYRDPTVA